MARRKTHFSALGPVVLRIPLPKPVKETVSEYASPDATEKEKEECSCSVAYKEFGLPRAEFAARIAVWKNKPTSLYLRCTPELHAAIEEIRVARAKRGPKQERSRRY